MKASDVANYNFLMVGRSGAGKSATSKQLTCNPDIVVANSLKQVTRCATFYKGQPTQLQTDETVCFNILDVPGLDQIGNRFVIREQILRILEKEAVNLHGILYISSLTERDTKDCNKLFNFIEQLPWANENKKNCLIPILTKYDNLVIDSSDDEIRNTKQEYKEIFEKAGYSTAWSKRVYWVNPTKSIEFKMKSYQQVRVTVETQIERLVEMKKRSKAALTPKQIILQIEQQQDFIALSLFKLMKAEKLPYKREEKKHKLSIKVEIQPKKVHQGIAALSASSIGLFMVKVLEKQVPTALKVVMASVPIVMALCNMRGVTTMLHGKKVAQESSGVEVLQTYARLCHRINVQAENEWKSLNNKIQFKAGSKNLYCTIDCENTFKFIDLGFLAFSIDDDYFLDVSGTNPQKKQSFYEKTQGFEQKKSSFATKGKLETEEQSQFMKHQTQHIQKKFRISLPKIHSQKLCWQPNIEIQYGVKIYEQQLLLKQIEKLRHEFYSKKN